MERKQHHSHSGREDVAGTEHDRQDGGAGRDPGRRVGGGGRELLASEDEDLQDEDKEGEADEDAGPTAEAAAKGVSKGIIKQHIRNAWEAVREHEASIARGTYDTLKEPDDGKTRTAGFFGTLFTGLTDVGVSTLIAKINPTTAVGAALFAVYNAAKAEVAKQLPKADNKSKIVASEFVEGYVRRITTEWHNGGDRLEFRMENRSKKMLLSLRKRMRELARKTSIDNPKIRDSILTAWVAALNREHKQEDKSNDFVTATSGRLHLVGVVLTAPSRGVKAAEQIHGLSARVDGTGSIRSRIGLRTLGAVKVPVTVAGHFVEEGTFSFGIGPSNNGVPTLGPHQKGTEGALERYGGLTKLWNKMKGEKVDDLVGDNKKGGKDGKNDAIQGGD